jgi:hypothetical protein
MSRKILNLLRSYAVGLDGGKYSLFVMTRVGEIGSMESKLQNSEARSQELELRKILCSMLCLLSALF